MSFIVILTILCVSIVKINAQVTGWTYNTQYGSSCQGTTSSPCGPAYWNKVSQQCAMSSNSYPQSPIDISNAPLVDTLPVPVFTTLNDGCSTWTQSVSYDDLHIDFTPSNTKCTNHYMTYESQNWYLQEIVFRSPSDHSIGGGFYDAEAQFIHVSSSTGQTAIVSVLMMASASTAITTNGNLFLANIWNYVTNFTPTSPYSNPVYATNGVNQDLSPYVDFFPGTKGMYQYVGTLTEPPCTGDVDWFIMADPVPISQQDLSRIRGFPSKITGNTLSQTGDNNRPTQMNPTAVSVSYTDGTTTYGTTTTTTVNNSNKSDSAALTLAAISFSFIMILIIFLIYKNGNITWNYEKNVESYNVQETKNPMSDV